MVNSPEKTDAVAHEQNQLPDSTPLLRDHAALRGRWEKDGVLYFRNVVDPQAVATVRNHYLHHLQEVGVVASGDTQPIWTGADRIDGALATKIGDDIWQGLVEHPTFDAVVRAVLGEAPSWVPIVVHRAAPPSSPTAVVADKFQGRHQDGVFNSGIDFVTCWVPLMDIDQTVGGLAVVPGSHKQSFYDFDHGMPAQAQPIPSGKIGDDLWRRPDYQAGDILMFHSMTAHSGLPNQSDRFRLSIDVRFLPSSKPRPVVGKVESYDGERVSIVEPSGERFSLVVDEETMVRGPKANRVYGEALFAVLASGANVIAAPDHGDHARLVRSVSRKYLDLPAAWFAPLPADWVN